MRKVSVQSLIESGVLVINDGHRMKSSELQDSPGLPFIRGGDVADGRIDFSEPDFIDEELRDTFGNKVSQPNDVVITTKGSVGRFAYVRKSYPEFVYSPQLSFWRVKDESVVLSDYLWQWVRSPAFSHQLGMYKGQTTMADYISLEDQRRIEVSLPPLPVQRRIADILGALDDKIELNRRMNRTLEDMAQTLYYHMFDGTIEGDGVPLTDLVTLNPRSRVPDDDEVLTYVGMADIPTHQMSVPEIGRKEYTSGRRFRNHDTLMARITPSLENGKTAFVDFLGEDEMAFGSTEFTVMRPKEGVSPCFVYCCARDDRFREYAISTMTGTSGRQRVQEKRLGAYAFDELSEDVMSQFHEKAWPLFERVTSNTNENRVLAATRAYLLPKLISGEISVDVAKAAA